MTNLVSRRALLATGGLLAVGSARFDAAAAAPSPPTYRRAVESLPGFPTFKTLDLPSLDAPHLRADLSTVQKNPAFKGLGPINVRMNADGFPLGHVPRTNTYAVHPSVATSWINQHFYAFQNSADRSYLDAALRALAWLHDDATVLQTPRGPARFAAYRFAWPGSDRNPWYSAFGNGRAVGSCLQAWLLTGDRTWLGRAHEFFNAYLLPRDPHNPNQPWILGTHAGYLWTDENPQTNGDISTAINAVLPGWQGVGTYAELTGDNDARTISRGIYATYDMLTALVRVPGGVSWYDANHTARFNSYHVENAYAFYQMYKRTGYGPYGFTLDGLLADFPVNDGGFPVWVGAHQPIVAVRPGTGPRQAYTLTNPAAGYLTGTDTEYIQFGGSDRHHWIMTHTGPLAGLWLREGPAVHEVAKGPLNSQRPDWYDFAQVPRPVRFTPGVRINAYDYDAHGRILTHRSSSWPRGSLAHCVGRATVNGQPHVLIGDGIFAQMWVPLAQAQFLG